MNKIYRTDNININIQLTKRPLGSKELTHYNVPNIYKLLLIINRRFFDISWVYFNKCIQLLLYFFPLFKSTGRRWTVY